MAVGFREFGATLALGVAAMWVSPASAADVIYAPRADASTASLAHQGPNVAGSSIQVINGAVSSSNTAPAGGVSGGGDANLSWASSFQDGGTNYGDPLHSDAFASATLSEGRLRASVNATGPNNYGSPLGFASARLDDTLFFTNTSGGDLAVSFTYAFDGKLIDPYAGNPGGDVSLILGCDYYRCYNSNNQAIRFADTGVQVGGTMNYYFHDDSPSYFGENIYGGMNANFQTGLGAMNGVDGNVVGWITANLLIPTGQTSLGIRGLLDLDCRGGSSCDFGHTGQFSFGALPAGLTYGSASGVFLTAATSQPGGVPEPAAWMTMILGFGMIGAAARRRGHRVDPIRRLR